MTRIIEHLLKLFHFTSIETDNTHAQIFYHYTFIFFACVNLTLFSEKISTKSVFIFIDLGTKLLFNKHLLIAVASFLNMSRYKISNVNQVKIEHSECSNRMILKSLLICITKGSINSYFLEVHFLLQEYTMLVSNKT